MSKTVKIILIVAAVLIIIGACLCVLTTGGIITLGALLPSSTPAAQAARPAAPVEKTSVAPAPTRVVEETQAQTGLLDPEEGFFLDGVKMKVVDVRYSLINGGESAAYFISGDEGFLVVVTIASETKDLGFVYDHYRDTIRLVDLERNESAEFDWANWSWDESQTSNGYLRLSFPVNGTAERAALYMNDLTAIDITSLLPKADAVENPWMDYKTVFNIHGLDLRVQSAQLVPAYSLPTGGNFRKEDSGNKIAVVKFSSTSEDLSALGDWNPLLINPEDFDQPYHSGYIAWTTDANSRSGLMEIAYEVPPELKAFILYIPFDTLVDLTQIIQKK